MAEDLILDKNQDKKTRYKQAIPQWEALLFGEEDLIANLANTCSVLKEAFGFFWVGFYLKKNDELVLGPFQGSPACTRIAFGRGVCGSSWKEGKTLIVPNVDEFHGHIACSSLSKSEIVIPIIKDDEVVAVLDVDSDKLDDFDEVDRLYLEAICDKLSSCF